EVLPGPRLALPGPDYAEPDQRAEPVRRGRAGLDQELLAQRGRLFPAAGALQNVGLLAANADRVGSDVVLLAERDSWLDVRLGLGKVPLVGVGADQVGVGAPRLAMVAPGQRDVQRLAHLAGPLQALSRAAGGLGVERVAVDGRGAELDGQRLGPQGQ